VDRLVGNAGVVTARLFEPWVRCLVFTRGRILVAMDLTDFGADPQPTIGPYLIT
jgi:hypothetical protein